jgi:hypothetical protein
MRRKVEQLARKIADALSADERIECVTLGEAAESDVLDPYFSLILDVHFRTRIPSPAERASLYGDPADLETLSGVSKDRFFVDSIPVHVNYVSVDAIKKFMGGDEAYAMILLESGTHQLYRLQNGQVLFSRSTWLAEARSCLSSLGDPFWSGLRSAYGAKAEHFLSDLGAAALRSDSYFYQVSLAEFMRHCVSMLFALNRQFEPSHRFISSRIRELPLLPENFISRWDTLLRQEEALTPARKYEVAKILAMSLLQLSAGA